MYMYMYDMYVHIYVCVYTHTCCFVMCGLIELLCVCVYSWASVVIDICLIYVYMHNYACMYVCA